VAAGACRRPSAEETPISQQTSQAVDGVRMVAIDDSPDKDDTYGH
jgi:hypothetical protein